MENTNLLSYEELEKIDHEISYISDEELKISERLAEIMKQLEQDKKVNVSLLYHEAIKIGQQLNYYHTRLAYLHERLKLY